MNTQFASLRRFSQCRVRGSVAWSSILSIDINKHHRASFSSNRDEGRTAAALSTTSHNRQKITIQPLNENPIRSNDGTSSGAIVADRLRMARRYAIENMIETFPKHQKQPSRRGGSPHVIKVGSRPLQSSVLTNNETCVTFNNNNKTMLLSSMSDEELIAELARRRNNQSSQTSSPIVVAGGKELVKEHGLIPTGVHTIENPIRSNDGTSSGAIVADRLRMARRKAIENLTTTTTTE
jgi:hypothetical protein